MTAIPHGITYKCDDCGHSVLRHGPEPADWRERWCADGKLRHRCAACLKKRSVPDGEKFIASVVRRLIGPEDPDVVVGVALEDSVEQPDGTHTVWATVPAFYPRGGEE